MLVMGLTLYGAFSLSSAVGFGGGLLSLPIIALLFGVRGTSPLIATLGCTLSLYLALRYYRQVRLRPVLQLLWRALPGFVLGLYFYHYLPEAVLKILVGVFALYASWRADDLFNAKKNTPAAEYGVPLAAGVAHGTAACAGPLVVHFIARKTADKHTFRATIMSAWVALNLVFITGLIFGGGVDEDYFSRMIVALIFGSLGVATGERIHKRLANEAFRKAVRVVLFVSGVSLTVAGII